MEVPFPIIDAHLHWNSINELDPAIARMILKEFPFFNEMVKDDRNIQPLLDIMNREGVEKCFVINYMSPHVMGYSFQTNDWVADVCEESDGRMIPFGGVDPNSVENAGEKIRPYLESGKLKGIKVHGPHQLVSYSEYTRGLESQRNLYEVCEELGVPVTFHTGSSIFPRARSRFGNPMDLEDVLIDFPKMKVSMAHGGRPFWMREAEYLLSKFRNLYFDLSGIPPKLIPQWFPRFERYADRAMFASDFPSPGVPGIKKNAESLYTLLKENYKLPDATIHKIFYDNANSLL